MQIPARREHEPFARFQRVERALDRGGVVAESFGTAPKSATLRTRAGRAGIGGTAVHAPPVFGAGVRRAAVDVSCAIVRIESRCCKVDGRSAATPMLGDATPTATKTADIHRETFIETGPIGPAT